MNEISSMTKDFVEKTTGFDDAQASLRETDLRSPVDNQPIYEGLNNYQVESGDFKISKNIAGRRLTVDEVGILLRDKRSAHSMILFQKQQKVLRDVTNG